MTLTASQINELGRMTRDRTTRILRMKSVQLKLDWRAEFSPEQLLSCCDKTAACLGTAVNIPFTKVLLKYF